MKQHKYLGFILIVFLAVLFIPQTGLAQKPLVIGFEGDAATLDPHGRNETHDHHDSAPCVRKPDRL